MHNPNPLVSIITPTYNSAAYLGDLIESVRSSGYEHFEHIIIDDGSNDSGKTIELLESYPHLIWKSRENRGQYATMNEGVALAKGKIICFISADDLLAPGAINKAVEYLNNHPEVDGVFGDYGFINSTGEPINLLRPFKKAPGFLYPYCMHISHSSLYMREAFLARHNLSFNPDLRFVGDYEWIIRIIKSAEKIGKITNILSLIRVHDNQTSNRHFLLMKDEALKVQDEYHVSAILASLFRKILFFYRVLNEYRFRRIQGVKQLIKTRFQK